jgi:protein SCO1
MIAAIRRLLLCLALVAVAGCDNTPPKFRGVDITGAAGYATDFKLTDHNGKVRTLADFRGKVVVLFFGFTHCPDVCPTTLADLRDVMKMLGADAAGVQVLFVTLDPHRDKPELLAKYVPAFHPSFLGLYGEDAATRKTAKDFKIVHAIREGQTPESYTVDHTAATLILDTQGRLRLFHPYGLEAKLVAEDFKTLLKEKS